MRCSGFNPGGFGFAGAAGILPGSAPGPSHAMKPTAEQFEQLALAEIASLYRVANRLTRSPERSGDLVQETYLRAFRSRDSFDLQEHGMRPWLLRILRNLHLSRVDREKRQPVAMDG